MKKIAVLILLLFTIGCSKDTNVVSNSDLTSKNKPVESSQSTSYNNSSDPITVTGPMTISTNNLYPLIQQNSMLNVKLITGKYYEDWTPGPLSGRTWSGDFQLVISDENGTIKHEFPLSDYFRDQLIFNDLFELEFDDYNGDGDIDFTIGQYGTSNGNYYKLFTITKDEQIKELHVEGYEDLFISNRTSRYSTKLDKVSDTSFSKTMYDNSVGKEIKDIFVWNGNEFVKSEE